MFYSHEILTSTQYGVATIWLVATIGPRSNNRKITRKAIQGVNIPRACDTIIQPGAPIALRLQGNLLYGVSRVYSQQCTYMLTDVEKVQSHMRTFFRVWGTSSIDPQAGKAKREQLVIQDDPAFELNFDLPPFSLDDDGNVIAEMGDTQKTSSEMSPNTGKGSSGSQRSPLGAFNISSPHSSGLHQLDMPFGRESLESQIAQVGGKGNLGREDEEPLVMDDDWGIRIDENGNVVLADDEPQLPQLPPQQPGPAAADAQQQQNAPGEPAQEDEFMLNMGSDALPEAAAFPQQRRSNEDFVQEENSSSTVAAAAPARKQRRKPLIVPDQHTMLGSDELKAWQRDYPTHILEVASGRKTRNRPPAKQVARAQKTAYDHLFGNGIGRVGAPTGIPGLAHPLASMFAGPALERSILGFTLKRPDSEEEDNGDDHLQAGRRTSAEAFGADPNTPSRRVRPRLTDTPQAGRAAADDEHQHDAQLRPHDDDGGIIFDQDDNNLNLELGREEPGSAHARSDISAPWNRSAHGSSTRGSAAKGSALGGGSWHVSASPLHGRGAGLAPIERLSSDMNNPFGFGSDPPEMHSSVRGEDWGLTTSQALQAALDQEGRNFLEYIRDSARTKGQTRDDGEGGEGRSWVEFDGLFEEGNKTKAVVTQAFFNVLSLATRDVIKVEQEDWRVVPFGTIRLGVVLVGDEAEEIEEAEEGDEEVAMEGVTAEGVEGEEMEGVVGEGMEGVGI